MFTVSDSTEKCSPTYLKASRGAACATGTVLPKALAFHFGHAVVQKS